MSIFMGASVNSGAGQVNDEGSAAGRRKIWFLAAPEIFTKAIAPVDFVALLTLAKPAFVMDAATGRGRDPLPGTPSATICRWCLDSGVAWAALDVPDRAERAAAIGYLSRESAFFGILDKIEKLNGLDAEARAGLARCREERKEYEGLFVSGLMALNRSRNDARMAEISDFKYRYMRNMSSCFDSLAAFSTYPDEVKRMLDERHGSIAERALLGLGKAAEKTGERGFDALVFCGIGDCGGVRERILPRLAESRFTEAGWDF